MCDKSCGLKTSDSKAGLPQLMMWILDFYEAASVVSCGKSFKLLSLIPDSFLSVKDPHPVHAGRGSCKPERHKDDPESRRMDNLDAN